VIAALAICGTSFIYIFLKAMQQLNVVHDQKLWIVPTSIAMGLCEASILLMIVRADNLWLGVASGIGGGTGALIAMKLHKRIKK